MSEEDDDYGGLKPPQEAPLGEDEDEVEAKLQRRSARLEELHGDGDSRGTAS